jgi:outer membrane protein assembly factor BamB
MTRALRLVFTASLLTVAVASTTSAENWPQWRGPGGLGISQEKQLPAEWSPTKNVAWKTELPGSGHSSPVVWGDRIFLTAVIEGEKLPGVKPPPHTLGGQPFVHPESIAADLKHTFKVFAVDAKTGKIVWEHTPYEGPVYDARHRRSSFAAPTAATDGRMVFAYFGPEGLYAYDVAGKPLWQAVEKFAHLGLGVGTSPVLHGNLVIIQRDEDNGERSAIIAYDKATGKEAWRQKRNVTLSWGTPVIVTAPSTPSGRSGQAGSRTELITNGSEFIIAYDPATGKELWRAKGVESNAIHTPLVGKGLVIVTAGYPVKRVIALRPGNVADDKRVAWEYAKGTGYTVSNIISGDYLYLLTDNGIVTCIDVATGEVKYEGGRPPKPARFVASPVAFGGNVALTSEEGDTYMVKEGTSFEISRTNSIGEFTWSSPAIANGRIYIRGAKHLFAIGT